VTVCGQLEIMAEFPIHNIDVGVIVAYFLAIVVIGIYVSRRTRSGEDLFLAGRSLTWGVIGFSLFASNISSTTMIGLSGQAYSSGISVANYEWMASVVLVFMAIFFIPFFIKTRISTVPEFLQKRFDARSRNYFSALTIFLTIFVDTAGSLYAGAIVVQVFFPEVSIWTTCVVLSLLAGLYTAAGGLKAVVFTDVLQAVVLLIGSTVMAYMVFAEFDFSWSAISSALPEENLSLIRPLDDPALPWLGTLIGVPILGFYFWCTNQFIAQRILGARSVEDAQRGALLGGLLKLPILFIMVIPGAAAVLLYPNLPDSDLVFPVLVTELLPVGIVGLVLAGLMAAIMSSIDSALNSASTLIIKDFVEPRKSDMDPRQVAKYGRWATIMFMVIAASWAPMIQNFEGLFSYLQQALSYVVPPVVAVFLWGMFWQRGSAQGAFWTLVLGHGLSMGIFVLTQLGWIELHFTIIAGLLTAASSFFFVAVSLLSEAPAEEKVRDTTWGSRVIDDKPMVVVWYKNFNYQATALLVLTAVIVIAFW